MILTPERFINKRLSGLLTYPGAVPSRFLRIETVAGKYYSLNGTHSSGYCPGFSPGSLLAS